MLEQYVYKQQKQLRLGYTTGTCAVGAAYGAAKMLLTAQPLTEAAITTPKGLTVRLPLRDIQRLNDSVSCAVQKDGGDDPDVTDGLLIYAQVSRTPTGFTVEGGQGIGRVTKPGLACAVGEAAINPVPRRMITEALQRAAAEAGFAGGLRAVISAPGGEALAQRTFNPRLGITGGISILGTSGIVEPMSEQALVETIKAEISVKLASGQRYLLVTPGNYGEAYAKVDQRLQVADAVKCSNFLGETLDFAVQSQAAGLLLVGHIGKLIKVSGGIMNTHSRMADCRMELLAAHAALCGAGQAVIQEIMACVSVDEGLAILTDEALRRRVLESLAAKIEFYLQARVQQKLMVGAVIFSNQYGLLAETSQVGQLIEQITKQERGGQEA